MKKTEYDNEDIWMLMTIKRRLKNVFMSLHMYHRVCSNAKFITHTIS